MKTKLLMLCCLTVQCSISACQLKQPTTTNDAGLTTSSVINGADLLGHIQTLASDEFEGRAPLSTGERKTLNYLENAFRDAGLQPLFGDSYRQPVPLVSITAAVEQPASITNQQQKPVIQLDYGKDIMLWTTRVVETSAVQESPLVFVGYGINAPEKNWNDYKNIDMRGKTALILVNDPGFATQDPALFNGNAMTYYGRWTYKFEEAARQGAAAAIVIHQTAPASYPWAVVESSWSGPQFHLTSADNNMQRVNIEAWLQHSAAADLMRRAGLSLAELEQQALSPAFEPTELNLSFNSNFTNQIVRNESFNVGAVVRGREAAEEAFIYMAHWDHIGKAENGTAGEDLIYNGALDNATGTAGLLLLAKAFAELPEAPRRSVAFLAVTAEESGLIGSAHYASSPAFSMRNTVAGINMDGLNMYGPLDDILVVGYGSSEMEDYLKSATRHQQRSVTPDASPQRGGYYRSDHFNFAKRGVPILYAGGGTSHREKGAEYYRERRADYVANHYHKPSDEVRQDWDPDGAIEDLQLFFSIGNRISNSRDWPEWYPGNEFKPIRDASRTSMQ